MFKFAKYVNKFIVLALIVITLLRILFKCLGIEGFTYVPPIDFLIKLTFTITDIYVEPLNRIFFVIQSFFPSFIKYYFPIIEFKSKAYIFEWASIIGILLIFIAGIVIEHILSTLQHFNKELIEIISESKKTKKIYPAKESTIEILTKPINSLNKSLQILIKKQQLTKIKDQNKQDDVNKLKSVYNIIIRRLDREKTELVNKNINLEKELITDNLTGLKTRGILDIRLKQEFTASKVRKTPLSVIMLDIDHFKSVNDNFGHQVGDIVLKDVAKIIINLCNINMTPSRYGGEEITIICPKYDREKAEHFANVIRKSIENNLKYDENFCTPITISAGIATFKGEENIKTADILMKNADIALYEAKDNGRNQVRVYKD